MSECQPDFDVESKGTGNTDQEAFLDAKGKAGRTAETVCANTDCPGHEFVKVKTISIKQDGDGYKCKLVSVWKCTTELG